MYDAPIRIITLRNRTAWGYIEISIEEPTNSSRGPAGPINHSPSTHFIFESEAALSNGSGGAQIISSEAVGRWPLGSLIATEAIG